MGTILKNLFLLIPVSLFEMVCGFSQAPDIIWQKCFGGDFGEGAYKIEQTYDKGFILFAGSSGIGGDVTENNGFSDYWIVKIDSNLNIDWQRSVGGSSFEFPASGVVALDSSYLILGKALSADGDISGPLGGNDFWLLKFSKEGALIWDRSYGGSGDDSGECIINTSDGGYMMAGGTAYSFDHDVTGNHGSEDFWVVKLDAAANLEWQKCYGGTDYDYANAIAQTVDGGYIIAGKTESSDGDVSENNGNADFWVVKIDSVGTLEWENTYGGTGYDIAYSVKSTLDGGYIVAGETDSNNGDVSGFHGGASDWWALKLDSLGNIDWQLPLGGSNGEEANLVLTVVDMGYLVAGFSISENMDVTANNGESDFWIVKLNLSGNIEWQKSIGSSQGEHAFDLITISDGNIVVAGYTTGNDFDVSGHHGADGSGDIWLVKLGFCNSVFYADMDGDGFGDISMDSVACNLPIGFVVDSTDCNDANMLIYPGVTEICNAIDDNCNTDIDEGLIYYTLFLDNDSDGYGNAEIFSISCLETIAGYVSDSTDCNDTDNTIYPGAEELCNYLDDDCDGIADDNLAYILSFEDADNDNYGNIAVDSLSCELPDGYVLSNTDCDDTNALIYPGAEEILNGVDDDCNGLSDEGLNLANYLQNQIKVYPNPATDFLLINYLGNELLLLEITNITGEIIYTIQTQQQDYTIDISKFAAGVYILKAQGITAEAIVPFVKE